MAPARLVVVSGVSPGQAFDLTGQNLSVGRAPDNSIVFSDPTISRKHCQIVYSNGAWHVIDLTGVGRTVLNGVPLSGGGDLRAGDLIQMGTTVLQFQTAAIGGAPTQPMPAYGQMPNPTYMGYGGAVPSPGYGIAALVLGIISVLFVCFWFLAYPTGILAIIFGYLGMKTQSRQMALAGFICGIVGIAFNVIFILFLAASMASGSGAR